MAGPTFPDQHPTAEEILCLLDGELPRTEGLRVEAHLKSCASCRTTYLHFADTANRYPGKSVLPDLSADQIEPISIRILQPPVIPSASRVPWRFVPNSVAAGLAFLLASGVAWQLFLRAPGVSANEIIARAAVQERKIVERLSGDGMRRRVLAVKTVNERVSRSAERWETVSRKTVSSSDLTSLELEISSSIPFRECRQLAPFTAEMVKCLANSSEIEVTATPDSRNGTDGYQILLTSLHPITQQAFLSRWRLRSSDWHFTEATFQFITGEGLTEYRLAELRMQLAHLPRVQAGAVSAPDKPTRAPHPGMPVPAAAAPLPDARLGERLTKSLEIYEALFELGLRTDEELHVEAGGSGDLRLKGLVTTRSRREEVERIGSQLGITVSVDTFEEAVSRIPVSTRETHFPETAESDRTRSGVDPEVLRSEGPLMETLLTERFGKDSPGKMAAIAFGDRVIETSQELLFRAKWLQRVKSEFSPKAVLAMPSEGQRRLAMLEQAQLELIAQRHEELRQLVARVLCDLPCVELSSGDAANSAFQTLADEFMDETPAYPWLEHLAAETAVLKTMFVDRAFQAINESEARELWREKNSRVSELLKEHQRLLAGQSRGDGVLVRR